MKSHLFDSGILCIEQVPCTGFLSMDPYLQHGKRVEMRGKSSHDRQAFYLRAHTARKDRNKGKSGAQPGTLTTGPTGGQWEVEAWKWKWKWSRLVARGRTVLEALLGWGFSVESGLSNAGGEKYQGCHVIMGPEDKSSRNGKARIVFTKQSGRSRRRCRGVGFGGSCGRAERRESPGIQQSQGDAI